MFTTIKTWWSNIPEKTKGILLAVALSSPAMIWALYNLYHVGHQWWNQEVTQITAGSSPYVTPPLDKLTKEEAEDFKTHNIITSVTIPNPTSKQLNKVVVMVPRQGYVAILDADNKIPLFKKHSGRVEISMIAPLSGLHVIMWHKDNWKLGEMILVSSEETGKVTLPVVEFRDFWGHYMYPIGFWLYTTLLVVILMWYGVAKLMKVPSLAQPVPVPTPQQPEVKCNGAVALSHSTNQPQ